MARRSRRALSLFSVLMLFVTMLPAMPVPALADVPALTAQEHQPAPAQAAIQNVSIPASSAQPQQPVLLEGEGGVRYVAGELIVRFAPQTSHSLALRSATKGQLSATGVATLDALGVKYSVQTLTPVFRQRVREQARAALAGLSAAPSLGDVYNLTFPAEADMVQLVADYTADPDVVYAEPNYVLEFDGTPDDTYFGQQWHLHNTGQYRLADADIDAPEAWNTVTGTETVVIAVIDTGVDRDHPDLDDHVWANPGETPGDGIDNDGNGYVDDTWGWNWVSDGADPGDYDSDDPRDDNGHGTHVAGIAAAETDNGAGVAGVCWNCRIMSLKAFESNGVGTISAIVQAIDYAADKGADVVNMSFGTYAESLLLEDTLADAYGQAVLAAAAGNYGTSPWLRTEPYYPASYAYVLGVGATDVGCVDPPACSMISEHRASFSNYGVNADVGAPGVSIYATFRGGGYASLSGTSMAAPIVSGLAALLLSQNPTWSKEMARGQIIKTADSIYVSSYPFTDVGSGRVNAHRALTIVPTPDVALLDGSILYGDLGGDNDGIPDAGETFTITTQLKNTWGEALLTTAVLSTTDPYVTIISDTATFGDISAYATMRNNGSPFKMALDITAPNNHQVDLSVDISANGGAYDTSASFSFLVQRGIEIPDPLFPAVITQSMTLHSDYLYIVTQNMLVGEGVTLTIEPGTRLQFDPTRFIKIEGTLIADGTEDLPIAFTSNQPDPQPGDFKGIVFGDTATDMRLDGTPIITTVIASGDPTPLGGQFITFTMPAVMNPVGDIIFAATISGGTTSEGLFRWLRGHVLPIVSAGETVPDTGGATFTAFREAHLDNAGAVAVVADLSGGATDRALIHRSSAGTVKVAAAGDVLTGTGTFLDFQLPYITSNGNIRFTATYTDGVAQTGAFEFDVAATTITPIESHPSQNLNDNGLESVAVQEFTDAVTRTGIFMTTPDDTARLVATGDTLPDGGTVLSFTNVTTLPFLSRLGAVAATVDVASGTPGEQQLLLIKRDDSYAGGSILNHVVMEYGGGVLLESAAPYLSFCRLRYSSGIIPGGYANPFGVLVQQGSADRRVIIDDCEISHNTTRALWVGGDPVLVRRASIVDNYTRSGTYLDYWAAGAYLRGEGATLVDSYLAYNTDTSCSAVHTSFDVAPRTFLEGNRFESNSSSGGNICLTGEAFVRGNVISGQKSQTGHAEGDSAVDGGGSAFQITRHSQIIQFNTIVGNQADPGWRAGFDLPGHTIFLRESTASLNHNNIVGNYASYELYLSNYHDAREDVDARQNYWGTTDANEIRYDRIYDYWQDFEPGEATFQPFLTAPEPLAPGFLWSATTYPPDPVGAELMTVTLDFSRDMSVVIAPIVTFGVDEPYTQQSIESGQWISPTRWVGSYEVTVDTGDGINTLRVSDAEDTGGMPIAVDTRFTFVIQTAGTASILLEAAASVGQVDLTWVQNDVTDLAGYILYRSPTTNTNYVQIGDGMFITTAYTDTAVTNGVTYYYRYSVLDTDFNEVAWSNEVSVTPDDYTLPSTPSVTDDGATTTYFDRLHAIWSSVDPETGIAEYQYCIGTASDSCDTISWTSMGTLTETTKTNLNLAHGQTYYFSVRARNGADHWSTAGSSDGITVDRLPPPVITAVEPISGVRSTSHVITFTGSGFQANPAPTVRLGTTALGSVTVADATQLTAQVSAGIAAGVYTVTVTNFDTQVGTLARAYAATNPVVGPRVFLLSPSTQRVGDDETSTTVDVQIQDVSDLAAFQFDVTYDPAVVHVDNVTLGWFLGSGGRNTAALGPTIDNITGLVTFGGFSYGTGAAADGSGTLATITFSPETTGTTSLTLTNVQLRDTLNSEIPADPQDGEIEVVHYPFGDLDRDCDVDIEDIMAVASRWNDPGTYDAAYDFDVDGDIDVADIMQVATVWGDTCGGGMMMQTSGGLDEAGPMLLLVPSITQAQVGEHVEIGVVVEGTQNLGGVQFDLVFDPIQIDLEGVTLGPALASTGNTAQVLEPIVDLTAGRVTCGGFSYGERSGPDAGQLMVVSLVPREEGAATVDLSGAQLVDLDGQIQTAANIVSARLVVGQTRLYLPLICRALN